MRVLRKLKITEISACDKPGSPHCKSVIMKSDSTRDGVHVGPEHARLHSLAIDLQRTKPGLSYRQAVGNLLQANASLRARVKAEHLDHELSNTKQKGAAKMKVDFVKNATSSDSIALQKVCDDGELDDLTKADLHRLIEKRAEELRADGETLPIAYSRFVTADPAGRLLFKIYQAASI